MIVTFIRHGESTDNLKPVWAGWKDAPLSDHGMNQARALGKHWKETPITAVFCSDLKRAHTTALQLVAQRNPESVLTPTVNPLLREQNFGIAEGKPWAAGPSEKDETEEEVYYTIYNRHDKFPQGESLDDLALRAERALDETVWPCLETALQKATPETEEAHIVIVSHGLAISEMVSALLRRSPVPPPSSANYRGLANTGWTQVQIDIQACPPPNEDEREIKVIRIIGVNKCPHLIGLKRQGSGIGNTAHDERQKSIKEFFGGGGATKPSIEKDSFADQDDGAESDHGASTSTY